MVKKIILTTVIIMIYLFSFNIANNIIYLKKNNLENTKNILLYYQKERKEEIEYYIGILDIPKINLKRGFYSKESPLNNVNKNIYFVKESNNKMIILASHRGNSKVSYFNNLEKLIIGDEIKLNYQNNNYKYIIENIYDEEKDGKLNIYHKQNKYALILITCNKIDKKYQTIYVSYRKED